MGDPGETWRVERPPTVTVGVILLLLYAAVLLVGGMRLAVRYWHTEDLEGVFGWVGLGASAVGLVYLLLTVSAYLRQRWAGLLLGILTVPVVVYEVAVVAAFLGTFLAGGYFLGTFLTGGFGLLWLVIAVSVVALPPVAVVLLHVPSSRAFFRRRRPALR